MKSEKRKWLFRTLLLLTLALAALPACASADVGMNKKKFTLIAGESTKLKLQGLTGTESAIEWSVKREDVADITQDGKTAKVTAKAKGTTYIFATVDGVQYRCRLKVTEPTAAIRLNKAKKSLKKGKTYQLKATIEPEGAEKVSVRWKSSNKKVAKVNSRGKVTAIGAGTATITAYARNGNAAKASCRIKVKSDPIKLNVSQLNLTVGQKAKLKATSDMESSTYTWSSSDKTVATVTKKGKVKGMQPGTAVITARRAADGSTAACTVTVMAAGQTPTEPSANAKILLSLMQKYSDQVKADKAVGITWKYANSGPKNNWPDEYKRSRKKKVGYVNCALGVRWGLREMGMLDSSNFWGTAGSVVYHGTSKEQLLEHCVIQQVNKTPDQLLAEGNLLPGDICTYVTYGHTNVYAGNGLWYDFGRGANGKTVGGDYVFDSFGPVASVGMASTKIGTIIRLV